MLELSSAEMVGRVALAAALGSAVGLEREISGQPAGFRTHALLALGAALFGLISAHAFVPFTGTTSETNVRVDVTRVASQVAVGVGFLGAGAILKQPGGSIRGLTTAASLWVTAAVGLAAGLGYYAAAVAVTVATLLTLAGLRGVRRVVRRRLGREEEELTVRLTPDAEPGSVVAAIHALPGVRLRQLRIDRDEETASLVLVARLGGLPAAALEQAVAPLADRGDVEEVYLTRPR